MNKLLLTLALALALAFGSPAFSQERTWKTFSPEGGAWSILAPGVLRPDAEALEPGSKKGSYTFNDFTGFFAVIYRDSPKRLVPWKPNYQKHFRKVRDDMVKAAKGKLLSDEEFAANGFTGREIFVKVPVGSIVGFEGQSVTKYRVERARMFFHGKRFYVLLTVLPEAEINAPEVNGFFNSFVAK
jgi:hypothetical protein